MSVEFSKKNLMIDDRYIPLKFHLDKGETFPKIEENPPDKPP